MIGYPINRMPNDQIEIRRAVANDVPALQELFVRTIKTVCSKHYSEAQMRVWTSSVEFPERWLGKIVRQHYVVATLDGIIAGFASVEGDYLDMFYVDADHQGCGIGSAMLAHLEEFARGIGVSMLYADVSRTALRFFLNKGYTVVKENENLVQGVPLNNYTMQRNLSHPNQ